MAPKSKIPELAPISSILISESLISVPISPNSSGWNMIQMCAKFVDTGFCKYYEYDIVVNMTYHFARLEGDGLQKNVSTIDLVQKLSISQN